MNLQEAGSSTPLRSAQKDGTLSLPAGAEQLAEKVMFSIRHPRNMPQGLKPLLLE
jgi:hypothetical protein